jgi:hypothetical protein
MTIRRVLRGAGRAALGLVVLGSIGLVRRSRMGRGGRRPAIGGGYADEPGVAVTWRPLRWTAVLGGSAIAAYTLAVRPWHLRWGATAEEVSRPLPGDELVAEPSTSATHAITVHAPAGDIWPWLVQLGQNRGGLYSYEWLENLAGCQMRNTDRIIPELQHLQVGDLVRLGPEPYPAYTVWRLEPGRALVLRTADPHTGRAVEPSDVASGAWLGTWAFVLDQHDDRTTRLLVRLRNHWHPNLSNFLVGQVVTEPAHFVMERKMLKTIKRLVERPSPDHIVD